MTSFRAQKIVFKASLQVSHRLEKYLNKQDCLEKTSKNKFALKST